MTDRLKEIQSYLSTHINAACDDARWIMVAALAAEVLKLAERVGNEEREWKAMRLDRNEWQVMAESLDLRLCHMTKDRDKWQAHAEEAKRDFWESRDAALEEAARVCEKAQADQNTPSAYSFLAEGIRALKAHNAEMNK